MKIDFSLAFLNNFQMKRSVILNPLIYLRSHHVVPKSSQSCVQDFPKMPPCYANGIHFVYHDHVITRYVDDFAIVAGKPCDLKESELGESEVGPYGVKNS